MVKKIYLNSRKYVGMFVLVSDEDYDVLKQYHWHPQRDVTLGGIERFYVNGTVNKKAVSMSRFIMNAPKGFVVDHIDGNTLNNQRSNLRVVTPRQNKQNRQTKKKSNYPGIGWHGQVPTKPWQAVVSINRLKIDLGLFKTEREAFEAYKKAVHELTGEKVICEVEFDEPKMPVNLANLYKKEIGMEER